jgi:hypothetical protein
MICGLGRDRLEETRAGSVLVNFGRYPKKAIGHVRCAVLPTGGTSDGRGGDVRERRGSVFWLAMIAIRWLEKLTDGFQHIPLNLL